jgi:diguanylate cyclase (GGDEF)-like protein
MYVFLVAAALLVFAFFGVRLRKLQKMAYTDSLTKLPNRAALMKQLEQILHSRTSPSTMSAIIFLDLDNFKSINDRLGHAIGDRLLIQVAARLGAALRAGDTIARFGGDEFVIIANNLRHPGDAGLVYRRLASILEQPFQFGANRVKLAASAGIAFLRADSSNPDELLRDADIALYKAKAAGRGVMRIFASTS